MKNIKKLSACLMLIATVLFSCKKEIATVTYLGGTSPVLTATSLAPLVMTKADENKTWNTFTWTNPNYQMSTGISSQDVSYTIQFDSTGSNFTNPSIQEIVVAKDLSRGVTIKEINTAMAKLGLMENLPHNVEIRVKTNLTNGSATLYSNVLKCVITNYLDVAVPLPSSGNLYLVGDATAGGWNNPVPVPSQQFTKTSTTTYEITVALTGGKEYLILPVNGDWGHKYAVPNKTLAGLNTGGDFGFDKSDNFPGPTLTGNYKIVVDFKLGRFTVTKL
jgi:starch-binding outer membrane protein SusE/F